MRLSRLFNPCLFLALDALYPRLQTPQTGQWQTDHQQTSPTITKTVVSFDEKDVGIASLP